MGMNEMSEATHSGAVFENTGDNGIFIKCIDRARRSGINPTHYDEVIIFLGKEIDQYREKIEHFENIIEKQRGEIVNLRGFRSEEIKILSNSVYGTSQLEAVQENTAMEIIKSLSDNGYNISINLFKNDESEDK